MSASPTGRRSPTTSSLSVSARFRPVPPARRISAPLSSRGLWATQAAPPRLLRASGLPVNADGFLRVRDTLQSLDDSAVFGTGDCVSFESYPELAKNGVHAVRQGAVLFDNVAAFLRERPLQ